MVEQAICRILSGDSRRVIIPGWGAFIKRDSGETVFTDILQTDDGILKQTVAETFGTGTSGAESAVTLFADKAKKDIIRYGHTHIAGVGTVSLTPEGKYRFSPEQIQTKTDDRTDYRTVMPSTDAIHGNVRHAVTSSETENILHETISETTVTENKDTTNVSPTETDKAVAGESNSVEISGNVAHQPSIEPKTANKSRLRSALYGDDHDEDDTLYGTGTSGKTGTAPEQGIPAATQSAITDGYAAASKPEIHIRRPEKPRKRTDVVMIIAVIALIITLAVTIYGVLTERSINSMRGEEILIEMNGADQTQDTGDTDE